MIPYHILYLIFLPPPFPFSHFLSSKLQTQIQILQAQLAQRPPIEDVQELQKEYKNLELLLQGTQRENERCMAELERHVCHLTSTNAINEHTTGERRVKKCLNAS